MAAHDIEKMWENLLKEDIGSWVQIIQEIHELILSGEIEVAKGMLRTLIKVTCGYPAISDEVGRNSKSIMRMLSPDVDPGVKAFMAVVRAAERQSEKGDEPATMAGFFMPARRVVLCEIVCRIACANQQNSRSVTTGQGSNGLQCRH